MNSITTPPREGRAPSVLRASTGQGRFAGLIPLALLAISVSITFLLGAVVLSFTESVAFDIRQAVMVAIVVGGLLASAAIYTVAVVGTLRQVKRWQRIGDVSDATAALRGLAATALIVLVPVLLAIFLPHPGI